MNDFIVGVLSINQKEFPGELFITSDNTIMIELLKNTPNYRAITINPIGLLETKVVPHSSTLDFDTDVNIEADDMPATLLITYLQDLFDNSSYITIYFDSTRGELVNFNKKIDEISENLKNKLLFHGPDLTPVVQNGEERLPRIKAKKFSNSNFKLINGFSKILNEEQIATIRLALPYRFKLLSWEIVYNMIYDGVAIRTLYSKAGNLMPLMLLIETKDHMKIGAFLSCGMKIVRGYTGSGETFIFKFSPDFDIFKWSGKNDFFLAASPDSIAIGGGGGSAIFLDSSLSHGISECCETFSSPPLTDNSHFDVLNVELWHIKSNYSKSANS